MGLLDTILGRSKPVRANLDALFALPTAALTLQSAGGLVTSGHAGVCWKPPPGQGSADAQKEIGELVGDGFRHAHDSFDYGWLLLDDPDLEELVTKIHMANSTLQDNGWGPQLLVSVFGFVPGPGRARRRPGLPPALSLQARHLLPLRPGRCREGTPRHRAGAAYPLHGGSRPPVRTRFEPLVPHVGHAGLVTADAPERIIALQGAVNFRDLGGYAAEEGQRTRWRRLFRADGLGELTEGDLSVLRALGIRTVIDLRSGSELERGRFDVDAHPVAFHHFPFIEELPDAEEFDRQPGLLGSQYQEILRDAGPQIMAALEVLAAPDALPAVFHCTAGKDRTGVLSALVLTVLGVDEPTVVADYALSGEAMLRLRAKLILKYPEGRETIENIDEVFSAEPTQMEQLLDHLRDEYGSAEEYLAQVGARSDLVEALQAALLEPL